ncbi:PIN domain-containing protein [Chitinophaga nivalis]|uniref:PIN domain-containing protein n=1 Tax=Chitinophaga nivalis TaxID=2991709 RepID=A0ABT3IQW7_9BACT|nr:PIN domain-containing protein [Chitinophaga nivalis]MCW3463967.1 PIN domain-containing protein [Chitinophaga nivalis]MCW3486343.1 PIN domain-containing protein [Chitinophaga nivalis]
MTSSYLVLDTNIWIYLANGLDTQSSQHSARQHFALLRSLEDLVKDGMVTILINDIIILEWERNKANAYNYVQKLKNKITDTENKYKAKIRAGTLTNNDTQVYTNEINILKAEIQIQGLHVAGVEKFIYNSCTQIPIPDKIKIQVFDLAISKKPPFHNSKNNIADAGLLLSAADYLKDVLMYEDIQGFFISNNTAEFTNGKNKERFHPEILNILPTREIIYQNHLGTALNLREEIIKEYDEFRKKQAYYDSITFECKSVTCYDREDFVRIGYLDDEILFPVAQHNINQIDLFTQEVIRKKDPITCASGHCNFCGQLHFECPACGELVGIYEYNEPINCEGCNSIYIISKHGNHKMVEAQEGEEE